MKPLRNHIGYVIAFSFTLFLFFYPLIFMRKSFLYGDNFVQFFPWFKCYSEAVKNFNFPYWIRHMQGGFPLMAEGQVGGFYPLNILIFFLLPFNLAYNYSIILHFILGGVFTYLYTRKLGADEAGGYLASLLFCFGSGYAGCFYNIITLHTLAWFPLVLFLFEQHFSSRKLKYIFFASVILGFQLLAGFMQMALYSFVFYLMYFIHRCLLEKVRIRKAAFLIFIFTAIGFLIGLAQILLTLQLVNFSQRHSANLEFALWGSFSPIGFLGLVFPYAIRALASALYIGVFSLLFIIFGLMFPREYRNTKPLVLLLFVSLFFALGGYNPLYVLLLKISKFYIFRNPSKLLFFSTFSLAVIAGYAATGLFRAAEDKQVKVLNVFRLFLGLCAGLFVALKFILHFFQKELMQIGQWYVKKFIYGTSHHRYDINYYLEKLDSVFRTLRESFSLSNTFTAVSWAFVLAGIIAMPVILKKKLKKTLIILILLDIFIFSFSGTSVRGNFRPLSELTPSHEKILARLKADPQVFRILPFDIASGKLPKWSLPNANIIYGIDSIACYSPLAFKGYKEYLSGIEVVDDSLGLKASRQEALKTNYQMLKLLNVKYVLSSVKLDIDFLQMEAQQDGIFLYRLAGYLPRVFFTDDISGIVTEQPQNNLKIVRYHNGFLEVELETKSEGFLVFSESYYPGWRVSVDGVNKNILKVKEIIQAVAIAKGRHRVTFSYHPDFSIKKALRKKIIF